MSHDIATIVLIDGVLVYEYAPSPFEIADAMSRGIAVHGAASLGALRGVELRYLGMQGHGWVFKQYLNGVIHADDEVVTLMAPSTNTALTLPLVRIRFAIERCKNVNLISEEQGNTLLGELSGLYFEDRTTKTVAAICRACGLDVFITETLLSNRFDIKAIDTIDCLKIVANS
jgi:hypothetical protein